MNKFLPVGFLAFAFFAGCTSTVTTFGGGSGQGGASGTPSSATATATATNAGAGGAMNGSNSGSATSTTDVTISTSAVTSSSSGATPKPISCGDLVCDGNTELCCANRQSTSCIPAGSECMGIDVACSSAASCPSGQVCCSEGSFGNLKTLCKQDCGPGGFGGPFQLCETASECLNMEPCNEAFGGFKICGGGWGN